jgi:hypothetical protein
VFLEVLAAIRDRLRRFDFTFTLPPRVSLAQADALMEAFLAEPSGGERGLAATAALLDVLREPFGFREIRRGVVNAADAATGAAGDLECIGEDGAVRLAVEVKERRATIADLEQAIDKVHRAGVTELILCTPGIARADAAAIPEMVARAWAAGTSVYLLTLPDLLRAALPLQGEAGIRAFVAGIGAQLDRYNTNPRHRLAWKKVLDRLLRA